MSTQIVEVHVNGRAVRETAGVPLLHLLKRLELAIPHLCYHEALGPLQTCDTCLVQVDGVLQRACAVPVKAGLQVDTHVAQAQAAREEAVHRVLGNHDLYCTICDFNNGDCRVHEAAAALDAELPKYPFTEKPYAVDASNPFYRYDPDQCILCGRCVQACQNVQVTETLTIDWEAEVPRVVWDGGALINESSCVSCGHCVTVCPCNALMEKSMLGEAGLFTGLNEDLREASINLVKHSEQYTGMMPLMVLSDAEAVMRQQTLKQTKTVCTYCGVGCSFDVWTKGRQILKIQPAAEAPANGISTCIKGKFGWDFVNSEERLTAPLVRRDGAFVEASWDEALDEIVARLRAIRDEHGPDSIAFVASSKCTNEETYLVQKIARAVIGTNNVDNCARYCQSPASMALSRTVGIGGDAGTMDDIRQAELVVMVGTNTATSHPVLAAHLRGRQKNHGQVHVVADLRRHEMADRADVFLQPHPGTDLVWINAVTKYIFDQGWEDRAFLDAKVNHEADLRQTLACYSLDYAEEVTGLAQDVLKDVAERIATAETVCGLWAMGLTQHVGGSDACTALSNLLLVTGNYGKPGTGGYPLRGHNNVQGACDFGALFDHFPGYESVEDPAVRSRYEAAWGVSLPAVPGLNNKTMIDAAADGRLKALFVIGEEMSLVDANVNHVREAMEQLEFMVVQDIFFSSTAAYADVVLAASPSLEKEGTFVNTERRIQRLYQALDPLGDSRPDWQILVDLARRFGHDWGYRRPEDIMDEVASITPMFAGVTYERLQGYRSLCWPVAEDGTDSPLLYTERFAFPDGKARLFPVDWTPPHETADQGDGAAGDDAYDLHLNNGRVLEHFHEGNMTYKIRGIRQKVADAFVEVSPAEAQRRGLEDGDWVRLTSRRGKLKTRVVVSDAVRDGELYLAMNSSEEPVNLLTSSEADKDVDTPAYKEVAVRLEKLGRRGPWALPRTNPRNGTPTPRPGVEVQKKWDRPDYRMPPEQRPPDGNV